VKSDSQSAREFHNNYFWILSVLLVCAGRRHVRLAQAQARAVVRYSKIALRHAKRPQSYGRLAQRESASFTPRRSLVRSQYRPQETAGQPSQIYRQLAWRANVGSNGQGRRAAPRASASIRGIEG
jgi:hypothetical protein